MNGLSDPAPNGARGSGGSHCAPTHRGGSGMGNGVGGRKPGEKSRKGVDAASLGDGFYPLSRGKFLFSSNLQLPCCRAMPSFPVQPRPPGGWAPRRPAAPANGEHFPRAAKSGGCLPPTLRQVSAGTPLAPRSLHPLPSLPALTLQGVPRSPCPRPIRVPGPRAL